MIDTIILSLSQLWIFNVKKYLLILYLWIWTQFLWSKHHWRGYKYTCHAEGKESRYTNRHHLKSVIEDSRTGEHFSLRTDTRKQSETGIASEMQSETAPSSFLAVSERMDRISTGWNVHSVMKLNNKKHGLLRNGQNVNQSKGIVGKSREQWSWNENNLEIYQRWSTSNLLHPTLGHSATQRLGTCPMSHK